MSKTEIELRQAAIALLNRKPVEHWVREWEQAYRLLKAIEASQTAEQREQEEGGFAA